ncbi:MAG: peptidoglycan-associated lipoprotein Pal [Pseudomonadota bacterium]
MKNLTRLILLAAVAAILAACGGTQTQPEPADPEPVQRDRPPVEANPLPPIDDHTKKENLNREGSLLTRRIIYFDFDQSRVKPEYQDVLNAHATYLGANAGARVTLEGHADERGTREYNLGLGERRGNTVSDLVDAQGASASQLSVVSYGEERPASNCSDESCWGSNRRVEIIYTREQ